jgi:hypothetical protein
MPGRILGRPAAEKADERHRRLCPSGTRSGQQTTEAGKSIAPPHSVTSHADHPQAIESAGTLPRPSRCVRSESLATTPPDRRRCSKRALDGARRPARRRRRWLKGCAVGRTSGASSVDLGVRRWMRRGRWGMPIAFWSACWISCREVLSLANSKKAVSPDASCVRVPRDEFSHLFESLARSGCVGRYNRLKHVRYS